MTRGASAAPRGAGEPVEFNWYSTGVPGPGARDVRGLPDHRSCEPESDGSHVARRSRRVSGCPTPPPGRALGPSVTRAATRRPRYPRRVKHVDFFYDLACPYAYLAHGRVDAACARHGATVAWRPFLLGGVFRAIGTPDRPGEHMPPAKAAMNLLDMTRWAAFHGVPFHMPATHPNRTVLALRAVIASGDPVRASRALFHAYWARGLDVSRPDVVREALDQAGLDGAALVAKAEDPEIKDALRRATDEAIAAGVFGAPSFVVTVRDEPGRAGAVELFWGQDRLVLVEELLAGGPVAEPAPAAPSAEAPSAVASSGATSDAPSADGPSAVASSRATSGASSPRELEIWFDFSSPFAYLAAARVQRVAERAGARLVYRPFLLGGLFQAIGTPNVPLFEMPEAKKRHAVADMARWAARFGVPFAFPSRFPMSTVKALRMVLASPDEARAPLVDAVYRAYWAEDRDIADPTVLASIATDAGLDGPALVELASSETWKRALRTATDEAARRGIFGAPSFFANGLLFWGQDRLDLVERALGGWRPPGE